MTNERPPATVHLVLGPVGSGKTTWARERARAIGAVRFDLDDWMVRLFRPDRPDDGDRLAWYSERARRCVDQIWEIALDVTARGTPVVLELGLVRRAERGAFYRRVDADGRSLEITLLEVGRAERRARVRARNETRGETFSMVVPLPIFELASDLWEPPNTEELRRMGITTQRS